MSTIMCTRTAIVMTMSMSIRILTETAMCIHILTHMMKPTHILKAQPT